MTDPKVIRYHADRLNKMFGQKEGTYIEKAVFEQISKSTIGDPIIVNGHEINVTISMKAVASIILNSL